MAANTTTPIGTLQVILAIGTDTQIAYLGKSRSLSPCRRFLRSPPEPSPFTLTENTNSHAKGQQTDNLAVSVPNQQTPTTGNDRQANLAAMLSNFIDNLASRLPERNITTPNSNMTQSIPATTNAATADAAAVVSSHNQQMPEPSIAPSKSPGGPQIRATSDLLDELQRALTVAPPSSASSLSSPSMMAKPTASYLNQVCILKRVQGHRQCSHLKIILLIFVSHI